MQHRRDASVLATLPALCARRLTHAAPALLALAALLAPLATGPAAQEADAHFDAPVVVLDALHRFDHLLDLDADGDMDAVGWWWLPSGTLEQAEVTGWINAGDGKLAEAWSFTVVVPDGDVGTPQQLVTGRLDGDARDDFAVSYGRHVWAFTSEGGAAPALLHTFDHGTPVGSLAIADFDGDGDGDLAVGDGSITLYANLGRGFVASDAWTAQKGALLPCEISGDGAPDLALENAGVVHLYTVLDGALAGQSALLHGLGAAGARTLTAGDVDDDGDTDLVVFQTGGRYAVLRRTGPAALTVEPLQLGGPATHLFDVDGDGDLDGACCAGGGGAGSTTVNVQPAFFEIALNDGSGVFANAFAVEGLGAHHLAGVADLDGDGDKELVAGRVVYYPPAPITAPPHPTVAFEPFWPAQVADMDGDADPDLRFGTAGTLANAGDGAFAAASPLLPPAPAGTSWRGPGYPADLDGDGDVDLLVSHVTGTFFNPTVIGLRRLLNDGAGALFDGGVASPPGLDVHVKKTTFPDGYWTDAPDRAVIADADGDGDLDLLARAIADTAGTPAKTMVFWNDGTGFFTAGPVFDGEQIQAVADLNGDAFPDLVMLSGVRVHFGLGGGAFGPTVVVSDSGGNVIEDRLAVGELDDVPGPDIVAVHLSLVSAYWNDGVGAFTRDDDVFAGLLGSGSTTAPNRAFATDVNGDGRLDLVLGGRHHANNASWIVLRSADGTAWEEPVCQVLRPYAFADVDGDGDADALTTAVFRNRAFEGPDAGSRRQYGAGAAGGAGVTPVLGAGGPFRVGETLSVRLTGLPVGKLGIFSVGLSASDLPDTPWQGMPGYNWPWTVFFYVVGFGPGALPADGKLTLTWPVDPVITTVGPIFLQTVVADPTAPFGRVATNGLRMEFGD
jgi:hypothetical protein